MATDGSIFARLAARLALDRDWWLIILSAVLGTLTALGALGFIGTLQWVANRVGLLADGPAAWVILLIPLLGMGLTGLLVHYFAREASGHGVPQVIQALIERGGVIRARVGIVKVVASVLTVASGGSAGTEGPIVQIGATAGSVFGGRLGLTRDQLRTLVGCGAAAGISSIFNAPIAGVFFVLEILLRDFSVKTFTPIVVASVFSSVATHAFSGENNAIFQASASLEGTQFQYTELPTFILLGGLCGMVAVGFNRLLHFGEDVFDRVRVHPLVKPLIGAALLGAVGALYLVLAGVWGAKGNQASVPAFFGNGYTTIETLIDPAYYEPSGETDGSAPADAEAQGEAPESAPPGEAIGEGTGQIEQEMKELPFSLALLGILLVFKGVATTLTLASGGSGGVFAPSLFLGASAGAFLGVAFERIGLIPAGSSPAAYALIGMGAVLAASTHAPLTAILILFELTRNPFVVLPIMLAAAVATVIAQLIERDSIYTYKLRRAGVRVGQARDLTVLRKIRAGQCETMELAPEPIYASDPLAKLIDVQATYDLPDFVVVDTEGRYVGMVAGADIRRALIDREAIPLLLVAELIREDLPTIEANETLDLVMDKFAMSDTASLCIVTSGPDPSPIAMLTRGRVMQRYQAELDGS